MGRKKGGSGAKNGRDSNPKYLGVKYLVEKLFLPVLFWFAKEVQRFIPDRMFRRVKMILCLQQQQVL